MAEEIIGKVSATIRIRRQSTNSIFGLKRDIN